MSRRPESGNSVAASAVSPWRGHGPNARRSEEIRKNNGISIPLDTIRLRLLGVLFFWFSCGFQAYEKLHHYGDQRCRSVHCTGARLCHRVWQILGKYKSECSYARYTATTSCRCSNSFATNFFVPCAANASCWMTEIALRHRDMYRTICFETLHAHQLKGSVDNF